MGVAVLEGTHFRLGLLGFIFWARHPCFDNSGTGVSGEEGAEPSGGGALQAIPLRGQVPRGVASYATRVTEAVRQVCLVPHGVPLQWCFCFRTDQENQEAQGFWLPF